MPKPMFCRVLQPLGDTPERFLVFKDGLNLARWSGGAEASFTVDEQSARAVIAEMSARGVDMVIDYEHQSEGTGKALAAGWVKSWEWVRGDGLYANADWTAEAAQEIKSRQYRYYSPVFSLNEKGDRLEKIFSLALTNTPALTHILPIAAKDGGADAMIPTEILDALGLPETASVQQALESIMALKDGKTDDKTDDKPAAPDLNAASVALAAKLGLPDVKDEATFVAAFTKVKETKPAINPAEYVPVGELAKLREELDAIRSANRIIASAAFIDNGMKQGKIVASTKSMWESLFATDGAKALEHLTAAPVIVSMGQVTRPGQQTANEPEDKILAASSQDPERVAAYQRVKAYQRENKINSFSEAAALCGVA